MAKNLVCLSLVNCPSLTEVPSSLQYLDKLEELDLDLSYNLTSFPMLDSKVLRKLAIRRCLDMTTCPTISQNMKSLHLAETSIKEVPQSVASELESLYLNDCPEVTKFPDYLEDIEELYLNGTPIKALPELPPSLTTLTTHDCPSLETVTSTINIAWLWHRLDFRNCFKLDQKPLVAAMHLKIQSGEEIKGFDETIRMVLPGSEIPEWFGDKGIGSSLTIQLPSNCHQLKGIAFCLVFPPPLPYHEMPYEFDDHPEVRVNVVCHVKSKNGEHDGDDEVVLNSLKTCDSDHMILHYVLRLVNNLSKYSGNEVTFKFYHAVSPWGRRVDHEIRRPVELKSCGVYLHFDENLPADKSSEEN
uniref:C-JID domain-containing protein n=1 Tax=Populus alba TaxID=43335 RepID=A0A4U5NSN4_POPAL|nr:hypothetical protein D5086_0000242920 [Populus alba]